MSTPTAAVPQNDWPPRPWPTEDWPAPEVSWLPDEFFNAALWESEASGASAAPTAAASRGLLGGGGA